MASLSELQEFRAGLAAKGVDVNAPNFYQNPEWTAFLNQPSAYSPPPPVAAKPNPLIPSASMGSGAAGNPSYTAPAYTPQAPAANPPVITAPQPTTPANPPPPQTYAANDPALLERARGIGSQIAAGGVPSQDLMRQYRSSLDDLVYGTNPTGVTPGFGEAITSIYQNTLGRLPDQEGIDWWKKDFDSGKTLQEIEANIARSGEAQSRIADFQSRGFSSGNLYSDNPLFAGNEWAPAAIAGKGLAQQGLPYLQSGGTFDINAPITAGNVLRTVDDWSAYNATLGTPNQQPVDNQSFIDYANEIYSRIAPSATTQTGGATPTTTTPTTTTPRTTTPTTTTTMPRVTNPLLPRETTPPTAPLTTRPPTRYASEYPYQSPIARQMAAANDQRATPMTQPVGFASDNPLLNRFGTQRLGEYTGARETPGNVPGPFRPTVNPLPGIVGAAPGASGSSGSSGSTTGAPTLATAAALATGVPALVGLSGSALNEGIRALPGGADLLNALGIGTIGLEGLQLNSQGRLVRAPTPEGALPGTNMVSPQSLTFMENFNNALKPGWINLASAGLAALPDILNGDYLKGVGAGGGSYLGAAAGTAAGAGIGGIAGNFILPGLGAFVGSWLGRKVGGLFGPGGSVGPNGGQSMEIDRATGRLVPGLSGQDNSGQAQESFANKFMQGVAEVINDANSAIGGTFAPNYSPNLPLAVEVIGGKINVVDHEGGKREFAGNQVEDAFKYAVGVANSYPGLRIPA